MTAAITNWNEATEAVEQAASILLVTHVNPDGDAIGSLLGLGNALRELGKSVMTVVDGGVPDFLRFLPGARKARSTLRRGKWDLMISLDASDEERTGLAGAYGRRHTAKVINLDHHPTNTWFGQIFLVAPEAVSSTEIVFQWLNQWGRPISRDVAIPLLTGLVTDTMGFRTSNVTAATLGMAQTLIGAGASLPEIMARALVSKPYYTLELWKHALPSARLEGKILSAMVTQENLKQAHAPDVTDGGLVSLLAGVDEAAISIVFKELDDGRVEISMRCKPGFDVSGVAFGLGGGGHMQAAGATIAGPLDAARARVMPLLEAAAQNGKPPIA
jgi:phosphoesterase RecJ-like protein